MLDTNSRRGRFGLNTISILDGGHARIGSQSNVKVGAFILGIIVTGTSSSLPEPSSVSSCCLVGSDAACQSLDSSGRDDAERTGGRSGGLFGSVNGGGDDFESWLVRSGRYHLVDGCCY